MSKSGEHAAYAARVLVVDDNAGNGRLLQAMLGPAGFCVACATSGEAALASVAEEPPDLVLLDVMMPGMDGYEVARRLKADPASQHIPIIMLTALDDRDARLRGLQVGAEDFITKPVDRAELCMRVRNLARLRTGDDNRYGDALSGAIHSRTVDLLERTESLERETTVLSERAILLEQMRVEQLKFKDDFLSHVSHELRSPLTAIKQFTSILLAGHAGPLNEEQREYQLIVWRNIGQLQSMIDDLLEVTRLESGKLHIVPASVSIAAAVSDAIDTVRESARVRQIVLNVAIGERVLPAFADPTRLRQVFLILLDNAIKFTPVGGSVTVHVHPHPTMPQMLQCDVSDTGCGIGEERATRIFERLYQASGTEPGSRRGLGLGLYICQELVQAHGGRITVMDHAPRAGTTFTFTVPQFALEDIVAPLATLGHWPAPSVALIAVEAIAARGDADDESMQFWSREARELLARCILPNLDILLPDLDGKVDGPRLFIAVFANAMGAETLAERIRGQFAAHAVHPQAEVCISTSVLPLAALPPYEASRPDTMVSWLARTLRHGITTYHAASSAAYESSSQ